MILGTGGMANHHATHFAKIVGVEIVACVDVSNERVAAFAKKHKIKHNFASLDEALAWGAFDACTNVTPDKAHFATTMALIAAGKHVLCEKPLATDYASALSMTEAAENAYLVNMVNLTYRNVAPLQEARSRVLAGEIGTVRHVEASYLQSWLVSKAWGDWRTESQWLWRLSKKHGSNGVLGDIGIHILDFASYGSGQDIDHVFARLKTFDKQEGASIGEYDLDANESFAMTVDFKNGALGVIHASRWATGHLNELKLRIYGDKGALEVKHNSDSASLRACLGADIEKAVWKEVKVPPVPTNYDRFAAAVTSGRNEEPSFRHAAEIQKILDLAVVTEQERMEKRV